ncbi:MAG: hypothetical protein GY805_15940 [Chloroflexi bacterium]|nr:hypothetical protein [Chloroflexota bacterium]
MKLVNGWQRLKQDANSKWSGVKLWVVNNPLAALFAILFGLVVLPTAIFVIFDFHSTFR